MTRTFIKDVRILDGTGNPSFPGQVLVENEFIAGVWPSAPGANVGDARIVGGKGATLMPGLIEPHSHITFTNYTRSVEMGSIPPEEHMLITVRNARKMLDMGFTSCFSAASAKPRLDVVLRNAIDAGEFPGPRTLAASPEMTVTSGLGDVRLSHLYRENFAVVLDGADEFRRYARLMCREGVDTLKMNISGDAGTPASPSHTTVMTEAEVAAVSEVARAHGKRLAAHTRSAESVKLALRHGVDVLYHATLIDSEARDLLEANRERVFVAPTLGSLYATLHESESWGIKFSPVQRRAMEDELNTGIENMKALKKRGVRVLPGGDYGVAWAPIGANARDLDHFVRLLGFSPMEAILAATKSGAQIMHMSERTGCVQPGFLADLVLVKGDPLADVAILQGEDNILAVMKEGEFHKPFAG
ncbi:MAG: amidohydrolase family protein [Betaproteobacteria bacterium]|nr:amidohydrolase family protein [Betaproteobacteria bacterium]